MTERSALLEAVRRASGLNLAAFDESFLEKTLERRVTATSAGTREAYLRLLAEDRGEAAALSGALSITYSQFFREPLAFALLEKLILPRLAEEKAGREIRVWSAGCAAGQEPYSVAMLLDQMARERERPMPFRIFATDVSDVDLAAAQAGEYREQAVQEVRWKHLHAYFTRREGCFVVLPALKAHVEFSHHDLLDGQSASPPPSIFGDFDLVFCANLLFYYSREVRQSILHRLSGALAPSGYLVTGEAERAIVAGEAGLRQVAPPATVFQRTEGGSRWP